MERIKRDRISQVHHDGSVDIAEAEGFGRSVRDFPRALKILLCNPTNMLVNLAGATESLLVSGFATFMPKYIQNQYGQTAAMSATLGGLMAITGAGGGLVGGGILSRVLSLKVRGMLRMCTLSCITCLLLCFILMFTSCDQAKIAGVNVLYNDSSVSIERGNPNADCNHHCHCTTKSYEPVCGIDGIQYFSPCHAGCNSSFREENTPKYGNCSCINAGNRTIHEELAEPGMCAPPCHQLAIFLPFFFLVIFTTFMVYTPGALVSLRVVPNSQRAFAFGLKWLIMRFLGSVLGPPLFGAIFDRACVSWQEHCNQRGACWIYSRNELNTYVFVTVICVKFISATLLFSAYFSYKPPPEDIHRVEVKVGQENVAFDQNEYKVHKNVNNDITHF